MLATTAELTEIQCQIAHAIAQTLVKENADVNELSKAISYLRAYANRENAGASFFEYLKMLVRNGSKIGHSRRTPEYYQSLETACSRYLKAYQDDVSVLLQVLGWSSRLMHYYKNAGPIGEINAFMIEVGQILEAKVTKINGNKVTYQILETIKLSPKEPKMSKILLEGQTVLVEITELNEDGGIRKVKCVE